MGNSNPFKVNRVLKAPQVWMMQSSLLRVQIIYIHDSYHLENVKWKKVMSNTDCCELERRE